MLPRMFRMVLRLLALASVELVRPGTYAQLARLIEAPAQAATPASPRPSGSKAATSSARPDFGG